jgi:hypothetical protein
VLIFACLGSWRTASEQLSPSTETEHFSSRMLSPGTT